MVGNVDFVARRAIALGDLGEPGDLGKGFFEVACSPTTLSFVVAKVRDDDDAERSMRCDAIWM